jgi:hypothetical protein
MRRASVIGLTSTAAAMHSHIIAALKPAAVMVEEAGELHEAQLLACLSKDTQHLILIGDHKQLRPKVNDYTLETKFNLGVSMFERLINLNTPYRSLATQQRMRPELSSLVKPFYDDLQDHPRVLQSPNIRGVAKNMYWIDHNKFEDTESNPGKKVRFRVRIFATVYRRTDTNYSNYRSKSSTNLRQSTRSRWRSISYCRVTKPPR